MSFSNPIALWGLLALAVPVIVHFFSFRKTVTVLYSDTRLLQEVKKQQSTTNNLKHLLLLIARLLLITAIVLAFAGPQTKLDRAHGISGREAVSIYIDNSFSMQALSEDGPLLEVAKEAAREFIKSRRSDDRYQVITNDFLPSGQRVISKDEAMDVIDDIKPSAAFKALPQVVTRMKDALSASPLNSGKLYFFSDFQSTQIDGEKIAFDSLYRLHFIRLTGTEKKNVYIDSVWISTPVLEVGKPIDLVFKVKNEGDEAINNRRLTLKLDGTQQAIGNFTVAANGTSTDTLTFRCNKDGWTEAELTLEDYPITFDNKYFFTFNIRKKIPVGVFFETGYDKSFRALLENDPVFETKFYPIGSIPFDQINRFQCIIVTGSNTLSTGLTQNLKSALEQGKSVVVFPGDKPQLNSALQELGGVTLGGELKGKFETAKLQQEDPLFKEVFDRFPSNPNLPSISGFFPLTSSGAWFPLYETAQNQVWFARKKQGRGQLYVSGAPLNAQHTNFDRHALFVPTIYRICLLSTQNPPLAYRIGSTEQIEVEQIGNSEKAVRLTHNKIDFIPEQRSKNGITELMVSRFIPEPGIYELKQNDGSLLRKLAFNTDRRESRLKFPSEDAWDQLTARLKVKTTNLEKATQGGSIGKNTFTSGSIRKILMGVALLMILAELLLIKLWKS